MNDALPRLVLKSCPKGWQRDLDKAIRPEQTIANVRARLELSGEAILARTQRIDTGRLGIPVYLGICGPLARALMPVRKQMGKGSSPAQAEASALMELMERFAFFSFWADPPHVVRATWGRAQQLFGADLIPVEEIIASVQDHIDADLASSILDLVEWQFYPATELGSGSIVWLPLDWFRMLGEFNGSSAGNTNEESLLQGISELIERHVSALADKSRRPLPTIDPASCAVDPVLGGLIGTFAANGINLLLKDLSLGMPLPTVAALAWDPSTFPEKSEIVFTAGTASSPAKAAIRAITEVAQLAGDFCTGSCYEASGLPKFRTLAEADWLQSGPVVNLATLPDLQDGDILAELKGALAGLAPIRVYALETTRPELGIPAHYCIAPGLEFRERDKNQSVALFTGRKLVESANIAHARQGLAFLSAKMPTAHFLPFFAGQLDLREQRPDRAYVNFERAIDIQPDPDSEALALFYAAYALSQSGEWQKTVPLLERALLASPEMKEAANLLGAALFRLGDYVAAEEKFDQALRIDKGSAMDLANRGVARQMQGRIPEAVADLEAALALDPGIDFARERLKTLKTEQS